MACASERIKVKTCHSDDQDDNLSIVMKEMHTMTGKTHHFYLVSGKHSTVVVLTCLYIPQWNNKPETERKER